MQEIDTHINIMKFIVLVYSNWLGILESISNFKHDEAGCGHNVQAVDPIPQRDEQFRSLAAVAEEVRGPDTPSVSPPTTTIASRNLGSWVRSPCWMVARGRLLYLSHSSGFL